MHTRGPIAPWPETKGEGRGLSIWLYGLHLCFVGKEHRKGYFLVLNSLAWYRLINSIIITNLKLFVLIVPATQLCTEITVLKLSYVYVHAVNKRQYKPPHHTE